MVIPRDEKEATSNNPVLEKEEQRIVEDSPLTNLIIVVNSSNSDDVHLIGRVVQGSINWAVISNGGDHQNVVGAQLPYLLDKRLVHEVRATNTEVDDVNPGKKERAV